LPAILKTILKMNFNFNFKDKPGVAEASIRSVTNGRARHRMGKWGIKRNLKFGDRHRSAIEMQHPVNSAD
jgi:hypothetical protein